MRKGLFLAVFTASALAAGASAQQRNNLTGTWVATADVPKSADKSAGPTFGPKFSLAVDGDTVTMARGAGEDVVKGTFKVDGSETRLRVPGRTCTGDSISVETMTWDGDAIVHKRVATVAPGTDTPRPAAVHGVFRPESADTIAVELHVAATADRPARTFGTVYKRSTTEKMADPVAIPVVKQTAATIKDVAWIGTMWTGKTKTLEVEERWTPPASGGMLAIARSMRGDQLASFEFLCIAERFGTLVYYAMPNGRNPATPFTLSDLTPDSATFENPAHDFPKVVRYRKLEDGSLETTVSGANNERPQVVVLKKN